MSAINKIYCYTNNHSIINKIINKTRYFLQSAILKPSVTDHKLRFMFGQNNDVIAAQPNSRKRLTNDRNPNMFVVTVAKTHPRSWRMGINSAPSVDIEHVPTTSQKLAASWNGSVVAHRWKTHKGFEMNENKHCPCVWIRCIWHVHVWLTFRQKKFSLCLL